MIKHFGGRTWPRKGASFKHFDINGMPIVCTRSICKYLRSHALQLQLLISVKPRWNHPNCEYQRLARNAAQRKSAATAATPAADARCGQLIASTGTRRATGREGARRRPCNKCTMMSQAVPRTRMNIPLTLEASKTTAWRRHTEHRRPCCCSCITVRPPISPS
jgi:hypothetical protein